MPNNEAIAYFDPGADLTCHCEAGVIGRRFVAVSDPKQVASAALANDTLGGNIVISLCGAGGRALGVATYDALANEKVPVARGTKVMPVEAGAALTAGDRVQSDATGRAITYAAGANPAADPAILGIVLNSPTAAGQVAIVALNL
jgi:hypothetical protein